MFGYIRPCQSQLRVCELEAYKGVYCGLCAGLGRSFGLLMRATLSYDAAFLALLGMSMRAEAPALPQGRCTFNPAQKVCCCEASPDIDYAADVSALLLRLKFEDNLRDSGFWKGMASRLGLLAFGGYFRRAAERRPELSAVLEEQSRRQGEIEARGGAGVDESCEPTACMLQAVLSGMDAGQERVLSRLGYLMGRYIYLADAVDDLPEDRRSGGYNPLLNSEKADAGASDEELRRDGLSSVYLTIGEICATWQLLDTCHFRPILDNIFMLGLRGTADALLISDDKKRRPASIDKDDTASRDPSGGME